MAPKGGPAYRSNLPLTVNGRARVLKTRAAKRDKLNAIKEGILIDEKTISSSNIAITSIERTIAHSEEALAIYEANLASVRETKTRLRRILPRFDLGPESEKEDDSFAVCQRITTYIGDSRRQDTVPLDEQELELEKRVRELASMLSSLRLELLDWQEELMLAEDSINVLQTCKRNLDPILEMIESLLSPVRKVPNEVWERVFFFSTAGADITPYSKSRDPIISSISNVCQKWRQVALSQASLWTKIDVPNATWWSPEAKDIISTYMGRGAHQSAVFAIRSWFRSTWLSQAQMSTTRGSLYIDANEKAKYRYPHEMPYEIGSYIGTQRHDLAPVNIWSLCGDKSYALHLYIHYGNMKVEWKPEGMDSYRPVSLTVQSATPGTSEVIFDQLNVYAGCTDITLIDICPSVTAPISQPLTGLRRLCLQLSSFTSFNVQPLLHSTLEELNLWHSGDETFHNLLSEHQLPALHTLALSVHDANLFINLRAPNLKNLTIYGSQQPRKEALDYGVLTEEPAPNLQQIKLADWSTQELSADTIDTLKHVMALAPHLYGISFSNCALDGSRLLHLLDGVSNISSKELTIDKCSVITQADCELLSVLVRKLHVYT